MKHNKSPFKWAKRVNYYMVIDELITHEGDWSDNRSRVFKHRKDARIYAKQQRLLTGRSMQLRVQPTNVPA